MTEQKIKFMLCDSKTNTLMHMTFPNLVMKKNLLSYSTLFLACPYFHSVLKSLPIRGKNSGKTELSQNSWLQNFYKLLESSFIAIWFWIMLWSIIGNIEKEEKPPITSCPLYNTVWTQIITYIMHFVFYFGKKLQTDFKNEFLWLYFIMCNPSWVHR